MKLFNSYKDNKTGMEIIASDCSYNNACSFLESKLGMGNFIGCKSVNLEMTEIKYTTRNFYYDEYRGLLLGE